eukprot:CAMPEP_0117853514 /NCGR_PEP_ID=MMETSP0949-20121206/23766_1 /TAXON_ID=44440 /ORGANISM="Chattonella subsalsa, Strain CCMP2191" /LENGTH=54 /DNA_ID=CAMNT_0005701989 /DNA_START=77 /DNA_END=238 /DNA_ORIENTATION=+
MVAAAHSPELVGGCIITLHLDMVFSMALGGAGKGTVGAKGRKMAGDAHKEQVGI